MSASMANATGSNPVSLKDVMSFMKQESQRPAQDQAVLFGVTTKEGSSEQYIHETNLSWQELGRLWYIKLTNIHWYVLQPLFIDVFEKKWDTLMTKRSHCFCGKPHHAFSELNVTCIVAIENGSAARTSKVGSKSSTDTMWTNIRKAPPNMKGSNLLENYLDLSNIDKLHWHLTNCLGIYPPCRLRDDSKYGHYLTAGNLLELRHLSAHEKRASNWGANDFSNYVQNVAAECRQLASVLYPGGSPKLVEMENALSKCLTSVTDLDTENLVFRVISQMVRIGSFSKTTCPIPEINNYSAVYSRTRKVADILRAPSSLPRDAGVVHKVLCIPPINQLAYKAYHDVLRFLCEAVEWAYVIDLSGVGDGSGGFLAYFDPLPTNWVIWTNSYDESSDSATPVYLDRDCLNKFAALSSAHLVIPLPGDDFACAEPSRLKIFEHLLRSLELVDPPSPQPTLLVNTTAAYSSFMQSIWRCSNLFESLECEEAAKTLCNFTLLDVLCRPEINQILLRRSSTENASFVSAAADTWTFPHSELLHWHSGSVQARADVTANSNAYDPDSEEDDNENAGILREEQQRTRSNMLFEVEKEKQLKRHAVAFIESGAVADWSLFEHSVIGEVEQMQKVQELICCGHLKCYTLKHIFKAGGTTIMRHLLYNLSRERFNCIYMSHFDNMQKLSDLRAALVALNQLTGLEIVLLVDLTSDVEFSGSIKGELLRSLGKIPFLRLLVCEHYDDDSDAASHKLKLVKASPSTVVQKPAMRRGSSEVDLLRSELVEVLCSRSENESKAIADCMRKYCGLVGRKLPLPGSDDPEDFIPQSYFNIDGLLDTARVIKEMKSFGKRECWQGKLVHMCRSNAQLMKVLLFHPCEIFELSDYSDNGSPNPGLLDIVSSTANPLINIGMLLFGTDEYCERVARIADLLISRMSDTEIVVLQTVVFAALCAPGLKVNTKFVSSGYSPSPYILGLVNKITEVSSRNTHYSEFLIIATPRLAYILAENPGVFGISRDGNGSGTDALLEFLSNTLLPLLNQADTGHDKENFRRREMLRPILHRAFNDFNVWHWLPYPVKDMKFSYLVTLLWNYCRQKRLDVSDLFVQYARMIAMDNSVLLAKESIFKSKAEKLPISSRANALKENLNNLWAGEHARAVITFLTGACRLRESYALVLRTYKERERVYGTCLRVLNENLLEQMRLPEMVQHRYATVYRRHLESYFEHVKTPGVTEEGFFKVVEDLCNLAESHFYKAIDTSHRSWAFPLVGLAQCRATVYELLQHLLQRTSMPKFESLVTIIQQRVDINQYPTIREAVTELGMKKSYHFLREADIASTYIKREDNQEHTRGLVNKTITRLDKIRGIELSPADLANSELLKGESLFLNGAKCIHHLFAIGTPLAELATFEDIDNIVPSWKVDMENMMKLSAAAHLPPASTAILYGPKENQLKTLLGERVVWLVDKWKKAVVSKNAHGLGAHRAAVMLAVYYKLNFAEGHRYKNLIPNLQTALDEAIDIAQEYQHSAAVRCFIADRVSLPGQPLAGYFGVTSSPVLLALKKKGTVNQHSDWSNAFDDPSVNVRLFSGEVGVVLKRDLSSVHTDRYVYCNELECRVKYYANSVYRGDEEDPAVGATVKFGVGINNHGLWAYGLRVQD